MQKAPEKTLLLKNDFNTEKYLKHVKVPVRIIHSKNDPFIPVELAQKLYNKSSEITYKEFKTGGHSVTDAKIDDCIKFFKGLSD